MHCCVLNLSAAGEGVGRRVLGEDSSAFWVPLCKRTADRDPSTVPGSRPGVETLPVMGLSPIVSKGWRSPVYPSDWSYQRLDSWGTGLEWHRAPSDGPADPEA